jgi:ribonuclease PH
MKNKNYIENSKRGKKSKRIHRSIRRIIKNAVMLSRVTEDSIQGSRTVYKGNKHE